MSQKGNLPTADAIIATLRDSDRGPLKPQELSRELKMPQESFGHFKNQLLTLEGEGRIYRVKGDRYAVPDKINLIVGRMSMIRSGDAFLRPDDASNQDVFIPSADQASAMDGDQVVVRIESRPRGRNPVGSVIKVLERVHPTIVGTFHEKRKLNHVVPQDRRVGRDIVIPAGDEKGASDGDVVVVKIVHYGDRKLNPVGEVDKVLGPITDPGVDVLSVLYGYGLPLEFPDEVEEAAREIVRKGRPRPEEGRVDRRDLLVFTIDPADAKDHDDALSITPAGKGAWEIGVHIADVSYYVERGGTLDMEALERGTSVYLVDRVVPMLPHSLSSDLCSLRPDEDRYAVSLFVTIDDRGDVREHHFERTLIRSRHRLAYEDVQEVLDGQGSAGAQADAAIHQLDEIARKLRRKRQERGSIDFDLPEGRVVLGKGGEPVDIQRVLRLEAHRLIEDFMLLANEIVAAETSKKKLPSLYRVHEPPTAEKIESLREFLKSFGNTLPQRDIHSKDLQKVLERVEGRPEEKLLQTVVLRSMKRARYETKNQGHFGLATDNYAHFTSPIRRYPDLITHRVVLRALVYGKPIPEDWGGEELEAAALRSSLREKAASDAERDSVELKKIEFMERHLGETFEGTISGVTSFGFFVLLDDYFVEGLVHVNALEDDYYEFRQEEYSLVGDRKGRRFRLGDRVRVDMARVDKEERHIDFVLKEVLAPT